jgi:TRAP-type mannitol/chloroaromatic compound transport system permease small subunit
MSIGGGHQAWQIAPVCEITLHRLGTIPSNAPVKPAPPSGSRSGQIREAVVLPLLKFSQLIDRFGEQISHIANVMILTSCLISAGNAMMRYAFDMSSNAWLEVQWYMFAIAVMFGAAFTLKKNEHVRVDLVYMLLSPRGKLWLDVFGGFLFLLPMCILLGWLSWPFFMQSYNVNEYSGNAGGLIRWPIKLVLPLGFGLLALQGISEIVKAIGALRGYVAVEATYERPLQ